MTKADQLTKDPNYDEVRVGYPWGSAALKVKLVKLRTGNMNFV